MDYQVKVRVRNGRIVRKMRERGFETLAALVRHIDGGKVGGSTYIRILDLISMKQTPLTQRGDWRPEVLALCDALQSVPEDLFNEQQMTAPLRKNSGETFMDLPQVESLIGSGGVEDVEARVTVSKLLECLGERERRIVTARMEGASYREIGEELNIHGCRVHQIEYKAMKKLEVAARPKLLIAA